MIQTFQINQLEIEINYSQTETYTKEQLPIQQQTKYKNHCQQRLIDFREYTLTFDFMFNDICARILSPPKFKYSMYDLGTTISNYGKRTDFIVYSRKGFKMNCSLYQPHTVKHHRACIIYLHSMNGSRLQGLVYSQLLLQQGISYCTFDFSACGNSDGDKISFGASEKYDVQLVITKLKQTFYLNRFILWGRSMGAVAAVKYAQLCYDKFKSVLYYQKGEILGLVLDSAFKSLSQLLIEIGHTQTDIPMFLIKAGYYLIKNTLQQNGEFNISQLDLISSSSQQQQQEKDIQSLSSYPLSKVKHLQLPILFLASKQDKTVSCQHSIDMFNAYDSKKKEIAYFRGLHNQSREEDYLERVIGFVKKLLNQNTNKQIIKSNNNNNKSDSSFIVDPIKKSRRHSMELFLNNEIDNNIYQLQQSLSLASNRSTTRKISPSTVVNITPIDNLIPDPVTLPRTPHKPTLLQLIQSSIFKSTHTDCTQTVIQTQSIQQTCLCTMTFDNNLQLPPMKVNNNSNSNARIISNDNNHHYHHQQQRQQSIKNQHISQSYHREKDAVMKNYCWEKYLEAKPNFNCDRISLKKDTNKNH